MGKKHLELQFNENVQSQQNQTKDLKRNKNDFMLLNELEDSEKKIEELESQLNNLKIIFYELQYKTHKGNPLIKKLISKFPSMYILFKNKINFRNTLIDIKGYKAIKKNNLFDTGYYLQNNEDVRLACVDPLLHYIFHGFKEGRKPNSSFDSDYYLRTYEDVKKANLNPLIHYALYGLNEKRKIQNSLINLKKQLKIIKKGKNNQYNQDHSLIINSGFFDANWYLKNNPDVAKEDINPLFHFTQYGATEKRDPHPRFSTSTYLQKNPDVLASGMNPLLHYIKYGIAEGRETYPVLSDNDNFLFELTKLNLDKKLKKRILYVIHKGGGGTPHTNNDIVMHIKSDLDCYVLVSSSKILTLQRYYHDEVEDFYSWVIGSGWSAGDFYNPEFRNIYFNVLVGLKIDIVHIQHLVKHTFDLPEVAASLGLPIILSVHDFYYICPSYHLLDNKNRYCATQCTEGQEQCKVPIDELKDLPLLKKFVSEWRVEVSKILSYVEVLVSPSEVVKQIYVSVYPELAEKDFEVIGHGRDFRPVDDSSLFFEFPSVEEPIKILIPGNINIAKGGELIKRIKSVDDDSKLEFHFIGALDPHLGLQEYGVYHGPYERDEFGDLVKEVKPHFIGIFSICPETYCHTLSEAWSCGVPVLTTKLGAQEERVNETGGGWFIDHEDPLNAYDEIMRIVGSPDEYVHVVEEVKKITFKSTKEMANEYHRLYSYSLDIDTVPNFNNLKKSLKGKNNCLFLVNDSNNEIKQHFDRSYNNSFNLQNFLKYFSLKDKFCKDNNIKYFFFIVPDKSLVCKDFLPFSINLIKRNSDLINTFVPDFIRNLDHTCYFKNDSHINYVGGKELAYCYLNYMDKNFKREDFNRLVDEQINPINLDYNGDLTWEQNCSLSDEEKKNYINEKILKFENKFIVNINERLPTDFKEVGIRQTEYYENRCGFKKLKVLILRDSSFTYLKDVLSIYFKEILIYWDHWFFNKELVEWYKPDIILDIRTERFLEKMDDRI